MGGLFEGGGDDNGGQKIANEQLRIQQQQIRQSNNKIKAQRLRSLKRSLRGPQAFESPTSPDIRLVPGPDNTTIG